MRIGNPIRVLKVREPLVPAPGEGVDRRAAPKSRPEPRRPAEPKRAEPLECAAACQGS